jgi:pilus assembly protein CpaC
MMFISNLKTLIISFFILTMTLISSTEIRAQNPNSINVRSLDPLGHLQLEPHIINIAINKAQAISSAQAIKDVIIANPAIADVLVKTSNKIYLIAKKIGSTNIFLTDQNGDAIKHFIIEVSTDVIGAQEAIKQLTPHAKINLKAVGSSLVLSGTTRSPEEAADTVELARQFVDNDTKIINMLRVLNDQQVILKVRVAEMQRTAIKNLSVSASFSHAFHGRQQLINTQAFSPIGVTNAIGATLSVNKFGLSAASINALERQGLVKTLAEPTLTAISGETANFLAGGSIPTIVGVSDTDTIQIEQKEVGVALSFTPTVLSKKRISLRISTEVSRQSFENKLVLPTSSGGSVDIPGLSIRRAESTVNLGSGYSLMIAGLLQNDEVNAVDGTPWLKDLPILGALFESKAFNNRETELVILVTAYSAKPVLPTEELRLPTDGFKPASDIDIYLFGRLFKQYSQNTDGNVKILKGPFGYILE